MAKSNPGNTNAKPGKGRNRKGTIQKSFREKFTELLELPKDLLLDRPKLTLIGCRDMMIENYKSVLEYGVGYMRVKTGSGIVRITGNNLVIREISHDDIIISGTVHSVEFTDAG